MADVVVKIDTRGGSQSAGEVKKVEASLLDLGKAADRAERQSSSAFNRFDQKLRGIGQVQAGQGLQQLGSTLTTHVSLPLGIAGGAAVKMASDFETSFSRIVGLTDVPARDVAALREQVLQLGKQTAKSPQELANALYFIASAGIDASQALPVLTSSAKAASAGLGDTATVADLVTGAMNAYGASSLSATRATDVLTAAVRQGKAEPAEFAQTLGRVLPFAAQLGISFDQVAAATAALTNGSIDADIATTGLRQVMSDILNPSAQAAKQLEALGINSKQLRDVIRNQGLLPGLQMLKQQIGGNEDALGNIVPDVRALMAVLSLLGQDQAKVGKVFAETKNSVGATDAAFNVFAQTSSFQMKQAIVENEEALLKLGTAALPIVAKALGVVGDIVADVAAVFDALPGPVQDVVILLGLMAIAAGPLVSLGGTVLQLATAQGVLAASSSAAAAAQAAQAAAAASGTVALEGEAAAGAAASASLLGVAGSAAAVAAPVLLGVAAIAALAAISNKAEDSSNKWGVALGRTLKTLPGIGPAVMVAGFAIDKVSGAGKGFADDAGKKVKETLDDIIGSVTNLNLGLGQTPARFQDAAAAAKDWTSGIDASTGVSLDAAAADRAYANEQQKLNDMLADAANGEKERANAAREAARAKEDADAAVGDARQRLTDAEEKYAEAVKGTTAEERQRLAVELQSAKAAADRAGFDQSQAEERLSRLSAGASPKARREAELAVEEARARTAEANQRVGDSEKAIADAAPGSAANRAEVAAAERDVESARRAVAEATDRQRDAADKLLVSYANAVDPSKQVAQQQRDIADQMQRVIKAAEVDIGAQIAAGLLPADKAGQAFYLDLVAIHDMFPQLASSMDPLIAKIKNELYPTLSTFTSGTADLQFQFHSDGVTRRALGGPVAGDRWYLVGERGPELMRLGGGARGQVYPHDESRRMMSAGTPPLRPLAAGGVIGAGGRQFAQAQIVVVEKTTVENYNLGDVGVRQDMAEVERYTRQRARVASLSRGSRGRR